MIGQATAGVVSGLAGPLFNLVDKLFTSDEERAEAKREILEMDQRGELAQIGLNTIEAKHESIFVAGWRPFIGWVCGIALGYNYVIQPFASFAAAAVADPSVVDLINTLPRLDLTTMMPVLLGMLGLGGMRSYEKRAGVNKNR